MREFVSASPRDGCATRLTGSLPDHGSIPSAGLDATGEVIALRIDYPDPGYSFWPASRRTGNRVTPSVRRHAARNRTPESEHRKSIGIVRLLQGSSPSVH